MPSCWISCSSSRLFTLNAQYRFWKWKFLSLLVLGIFLFYFKYFFFYFPHVFEDIDWNALGMEIFFYFCAKPFRTWFFILEFFSSSSLSWCLFLSTFHISWCCCCFRFYVNWYYCWKIGARQGKKTSALYKFWFKFLELLS